MLVASMVLFIGVTAYLVASARRLSTSSDTPAASEVIPPPSSAAGAYGPCVDGLSGFSLTGANGDGICVGISPSGDESTSAVLIANGEQSGSFRITECQVALADVHFDSISSTDGARSASLWLVSSEVQTMVVHPPAADEVVAETFEVPGVPELRLAAFWIPNPDGQFGEVELLTASGEPWAPASTITTPSSCPEHE